MKTEETLKREHLAIGRVLGALGDLQDEDEQLVVLQAAAILLGIDLTTKAVAQ